MTLNLFSVQDFDSNVDESTFEFLGQWSTRFYIILLTIGLAILTLYTVIQPKTLTGAFEKPSVSEYNALRQAHGDRLQCSCSIIASKYDHFVKIKPIFHQVKRNYFQSMLLPLK